ncbi:MAG: adenosylcobinamide-GDP ribazoletransferase [Candidatus Bathyarchaeota archaeon]|nr:adenosylcobinamide-GDP ribazoletransferase [Candidatus Bathyarchaeota archaeon]
MFKAIKNLLAFLTVIPVRMDMDCLVDSARYMYLFPLIGALLGLLAGAFGYAMFLFLPASVAGALTLGVLLLLTGLHHADGLLDFGDAIMYQGTAERKIEIMHDQLTGAGALGLGIMTYITTAIAFGELQLGLVIQSVIIIELCAKLAMVVGARAGKAAHKGMNSSFLEQMHGAKGSLRLIAAVALSLLVAVPLMWLSGFPLVGFAVVAASVLTGLVMVFISHKHFKCITGDVLGATNELTRLVCTIVLLATVMAL